MKKILTICLILSLSLFLCGCDSTDYKKALQLYEDGSYKEAILMFENLGDYEESQEYILKCRYRLAVKALDNEDYEEALELFEDLGDYKDSEDYILQCKYAIACDTLDSEKYETARALFNDLGSYKDAAEKAESCARIMLDRAFAEKNWTLVVSLSENISGSNDKVTIAKAYLAYESLDYITARTLMATVEDTESADYAEATVFMADGFFTGSYSEAMAERDTEILTDAMNDYYEVNEEGTLPQEMLTETFTELSSTNDTDDFQFLDDIMTSLSGIPNAEAFTGSLQEILDEHLSERVMGYLTSHYWQRGDGNFAKGIIMEFVLEGDEYVGRIIDNSQSSGLLFYPGDIKWHNVRAISYNEVYAEDLYVTYNGNYQILTTQYDPGTATIDYERGELHLYIPAVNSSQVWTLVEKEGF